VNPRTRLVLGVAALLALTAAVAFAVAARSGDDSGPAAQVEEVEGPFAGRTSPFEGAVRPPAAPVDFTLRNQDGEPVRISSERGKVVVVSPMYTTCEDTCPIVAQQIRGALDDLDPAVRTRVRAHAVSVDTANDTPLSAQRFLLEQRVRGYLDFLLGSRGELAPVWREFGFAPQTREQEHSAYVVLLDREGRQRVGFPVDHLTPEGLRHDIELLAAERG
jgi:protein SCO1/2